MLNPNPSHKYDWIRIMQGRKLKHILNRQMFLLKCFAQMFFAQMFLLLLNNKCQLAVPGVLHFWHHVSQNVFPKMYFPKCILIGKCILNRKKREERGNISEVEELGPVQLSVTE